MKETLKALESTVVALADSYDQLVFLRHAVDRAVNATGIPDLLSLLYDAQVLMEAGGCALYVAGSWVGEVPGWLACQPVPRHRIFELALPRADAPATILGVPFGADPAEGGWIVFWEKREAFTAGDARLAENLAALITSTLGALRTRRDRFQQELEEHDRLLATRIWRHLVAERLPAPANYRLASLSQPASHVGGDFQVALGNWIMVGDVSGKGIAAALFTGMFVSSLRLAVQQRDVGAAIAVAVHEQLEAAEMLATLAVIEVQDDGRFRYLNMGHPPLLIRRADGRVESLRATAPPLGTFALDRYPMPAGQLGPGDLLCMVSDGVTEARRERADGTLEMVEVRGVEQMLKEAASPEHGLELITRALQDWQVQDDLTAVLIQYQPAQEERIQPQRATLAADTSQLAALGLFIREACPRLPRPGLPEVAVTELAANAIRHGGATRMTIEVTEQPGGYLLTFEDDGQPFDPTRSPLLPAGELREGGYGLIIVRRSTEALHYRRRDQWNSVNLYYPTGEQ